MATVLGMICDKLAILKKRKQVEEISLKDTLKAIQGMFAFAVIEVKIGDEEGPKYRVKTTDSG